VVVVSRKQFKYSAIQGIDKGEWLPQSGCSPLFFALSAKSSFAEG
jgi:hypothetical protein